MEKRVNAAKADIISGKIKVVDYRAASSCPQALIFLPPHFKRAAPGHSGAARF
jgi:hypothetical protein